MAKRHFRHTSPRRYLTRSGTDPVCVTTGLSRSYSVAPFQQGLIASLISQGIEWSEVTLHIGLATFRPVTADRVADHQIHRMVQRFSETAEAVEQAKSEGRRVIALGTTAARTLVLRRTLGGRIEGRFRLRHRCSLRLVINGQL